MRIGELFQGRYTLTQELPAVAFAKAYLATDTSLERQVEVVMLEPRFAAHQEFVKRFTEEARRVLDLAHPAIARIYDVGSDPDSGEHFIISEHIEGTTLRQRAAHPVSFDEALTQLESVFSALEYAHARGVYHLGLTSDSVTITAHGRAKISGFGISALASQAAPNADALAATLGTSAYLAPEQIVQTDVGPATDVYAAGLLLREALNGKPVFDGTARGEELRARAHGELPIDALAPTLPRDLAALMGSLAASTPSARPTARAAVDILAKAVTPASLLATEAVKAPPEVFVAVAPAASELNTPHVERPSVPAGIDPTLASIFPANSLSTREFGANEFTAGRTRKALVTALVLAVTSVIVVAALILVIVSLLPANFLPSTSRTVPQLAGLTYDQAASSVHNAGLVISRNDVASTTIPSEQVISSNPPSGTKLEMGGTVTVDVSSGNAMVAVPDLTGVASGAAAQILEKVGLKLGNTTQIASALAPKGSIVVSLPASGTQVAAGTLVNISVSNGLVRIPSFVGKSITEATATLGKPDIGITPTIAADPSCVGTNPISVSRQSPSPGDVPSNTKVTLTYCSGR